MTETETTQNGNGMAENEEYQKCTKAGIPAKVAEHLVDLIDSGLMQFEDLEERTIDPLKTMKADHAIHILKKFKDGNLIGVSNKASYLGLAIKAFRDRLNELGEVSALAQPVVRGPSMEKIQAILDRTGYPLEVTIGQRKYGPPPGTEEGASGAAELYVGKLPKEVFEDELVELFEDVGTIFDLRLMVDPFTMQHKGYAFVTYTTKDDAVAAAEKFEGHEIRPGKRIKCNVSTANTRLFVGNVPKKNSKEEILAEFSEFAENIEDIIVYPPTGEPNLKNRGFCFVEFADHKSASAVKRKLAARKARPFGREVIVDWADPLPETDEEAMKKVKALYVRPLSDGTTEDKLKELFEPHGEIESVKKINNYAFVHFVNREEAIKAIDTMNGSDIEGSTVEVSLAKPHVDKAKKDQIRRDRERRTAGQLQRGGGFGGGEGWGRGGMRGGPRGARGAGGFRGRGAGGFGGYGGGFENGYGAAAGMGYGDPYGYGGGYGGYGADPYGYGAGGYGDMMGYGAGYGMEMYGYGGGYEDYGYGAGMGGGYGYGGGYGDAYGAGRGGGRGFGRGRGGFKRKADGEGYGGGAAKKAAY